MALKSYDDVIEYLDKKKHSKHLLLGNGFSMAYNSEIFSYNALSRFVDDTDNEILKKLFAIINTKNFELIMQQLDNFRELAEVFSEDPKLEPKIAEASESLKSSLIDAIEQLHPEHVFTIQEGQHQACAAFLNSADSIFTTNYDILLYWVIMRNHESLGKPSDGFGYGESDNSPEREIESSELVWGPYKEIQNTYYLHGALHLFDTGTNVIKEQYRKNHNLLEKIRQRIEAKNYPVFVTAGDDKEKLTHIRHNQYLTHCYESLCSIGGALITFGFNFGNSDGHIVAAINRAATPSKNRDHIEDVFIGVYSTVDEGHIESIRNQFRCEVHMYDARTANVWGAE